MEHGGWNMGMRLCFILVSAAMCEAVLGRPVWPRILQLTGHSYKGLFPLAARSTSSSCEDEPAGAIRGYLLYSLAAPQLSLSRNLRLNTPSALRLLSRHHAYWQHLRDRRDVCRRRCALRF